MQYFMAENGRQMGPFEVTELLRNGLRPHSLVWCETMSDWDRADRVPELIPLFSYATQKHFDDARARVERDAFRASPSTEPRGVGVSQAAPAAAVDPYSASRSTRIAAGICGILLGGLGIHKFVLGYTTAGVIMLLISIGSCGIGWPVMKIIGIIEGIIYLVKSDPEFHRTYVANRREWF